MKHLLSQWRSLAQDSSAKKKILFLDFDGTLAKIVKQPQKAKLHPKIRLLLRKIAQDRKYRLAIISGRALEDVKNKVGIKDIVYAGNHGLEIEGPKIGFISPRLDKFKLTLRRLKAKLQKELGPVRGVLIEDKGLSLSVHSVWLKKGAWPLLKLLLPG